MCNYYFPAFGLFDRLDFRNGYYVCQNGKQRNES